jgi:hypothetical protein
VSDFPEQSRNASLGKEESSRLPDRIVGEGKRQPGAHSNWKERVRLGLKVAGAKVARKAVIPSAVQGLASDSTLHVY